MKSFKEFLCENQKENITIMPKEKKKLISILRYVMSGEHHHNYLAFGQIKGKWAYVTSRWALYNSATVKNFDWVEYVSHDPENQYNAEKIIDSAYNKHKK